MSYIVSFSKDEGPSVATIFVLRILSLQIKAYISNDKLCLAAKQV